MSDESPHPPGVLVVDDDASVLAYLCLALHEHGLTVWAAPDGGRAVRVYRRHHGCIRAVLLDTRRPGLDGPATLAALRQVNPGVRCCLVADPAGRRAADGLLRLGAAAVLHKPFEFTRLAQTLLRLAGSAGPPAR